MTLEEFMRTPQQLGFYRVLRRTPAGPDYAIWTTMRLDGRATEVGGWEWGWDWAGVYYEMSLSGVIEVSTYLGDALPFNEPAADDYMRGAPELLPADDDDLGDDGPQSLLGGLALLQERFMENLNDASLDRPFSEHQSVAIRDEVHALLDHVYEMICGLPTTKGPGPAPGHVRLELPL